MLPRANRRPRPLRRAVLTIALAATLAFAPGVAAQGASTPTGADLALMVQTTHTTNAYGSWPNWAQPDDVSLYTDADGGLQVVTVDTDAHTLTITPVDVAARTLGSPRSVSFDDFPLWGGFYAAPDGYLYIAVGRDNPDESTTRKVVAIRKYDQDWTLQGTGYLLGGATQEFAGVYTPFEAGRADFALAGSTLVVHMARLMFATNGVHHQSNLTFEVNTSSMDVTTLSDAWGTWNVPYSSHSFNQFVRAAGDNLVFVDHGDAYPRALQVAVATGGAKTPTDAHTIKAVNAFTFEGTIGDNTTGTSLTGVETGQGTVLVTGNSLPHDHAIGGVTGSTGSSRNVYVIAMSTSTRTPDFRWITTYDPTGTTAAGEPRMVKLSSTRYVLLFDVAVGSSHTLHYELLDASGATVASRTFPGVVYNPMAQPVVIGSSLYWAGYGVPAAQVPSTPRLYLFGLDVSSPEAPSLEGTTSTMVPGSPTITGTASAGETLTAMPGSWVPSGSSFSYQWLRDGEPVTGATAPTYVLGASDIGTKLSVRVTGTATGYESVSVVSPSTPTIAAHALTTHKPTIAGKRKVGRKLTVVRGTWEPSGIAFTYQWFRNGSPVEGAVHKTYRLHKADRHKRISVSVTGAKADYATATRTSSRTAKVK